MMSKNLLIQFASQYPPFRGGLGEIAKEIAFNAAQNPHTRVINCVSSAEQLSAMDRYEPIIFQNTTIGYMRDDYEVLVIPSFDIIYNFPCPNFFTKKFAHQMEYLRIAIGQSQYSVVQTHTRFFLRTMRGNLFAKWKKIRLVHVEHGSDYAVLNTWWKTWIARIRDETCGRWILSSSKVVAISKRVQGFVAKFTSHESELIHNGIDFLPSPRMEHEYIRIGFVGRLVKLKGVDLLLRAFAELLEKHSHISLHIVGGGDEENNLKKTASELGIPDSCTFYGSRDRDRISQEFLPMIDIFVNPSYMEGLPTSVLEALLSGCVVVATDVGGTTEISDKADLIVVKPGNESSIREGIDKAISDYISLAGLSKNHVAKSFSRKEQIKKYERVWRIT